MLVRERKNYYGRSLTCSTDAVNSGARTLAGGEQRRFEQRLAVDCSQVVTQLACFRCRDWAGTLAWGLGRHLAVGTGQTPGFRDWVGTLVQGLGWHLGVGTGLAPRCKDWA